MKRLLAYGRLVDSSTLKKIARRETANAIARGALVPQPCEQCGGLPADAHHPDYRKPLEVVWLCDRHHREVHAEALDFDTDLLRQMQDAVLRYGPLTQSGYMNGMGRFLSALGVKTLQSAIAADAGSVQRAIEALGMRGYAPGTVQLSVSAAKCLWRRFRLSGLTGADPFFDLRLEGGSAPADWNVLTPDRDKDFFAEVVEPRDKAMLLALRYQGWRVSELCGMKWGQLRPEYQMPGARILATFIGKRKKIAVQTVKPQVLSALLEWAGKRTEPEDPLICALPTGLRPLTRQDCYRIVKRYASSLGLRLTPHGLRGTYISEVINRLGIEKARQLARHESITTTQRYSRWQVIDDQTGAIEEFRPPPKVLEITDATRGLLDKILGPEDLPKKKG